MSHDTGTGHSSEGGSDPAKAASQGSSTWWKGSWLCHDSAPQHSPISSWKILQSSVPGCLYPPQIAETLKAATILPSREENKCI